MIEFFTKYLAYIVNLPLYWISSLLPKEEKLWVFGAWFGKRYSDNPKYLFEYVSENHPEIDAIWLTKTDEVVEDVRNKGYKAYSLYSAKGFAYCMKAKYVFCCQSVRADLLPFMLSKSQFNVQLWHGTPIKKIHFDSFADTLPRRLIRKTKGAIFPFLNEHYDLMLSSSETDRKLFSTAFDLPIEKIVVTGYPRNDVLVSKKEAKRKIVYLPTFRDSQGDNFDLFTSFDFDLDKLSTTLKKYEAEFYIKTHPVNSLSNHFLEALTDVDNIHLLDVADVYEVLAEFDMLVTDYSSIYIDYLLTNNPIVFAPFDIDSYMVNDRGFYYEYDRVTPGPKCRNWEEVYMQIDKLLKDPLLYSDARLQVRSMFHLHNDSKSCRRVVQAVSLLSSNRY